MNKFSLNHLHNPSFVVVSGVVKNGGKFVNIELNISTFWTSRDRAFAYVWKHKVAICSWAYKFQKNNMIYVRDGLVNFKFILY